MSTEVPLLKLILQELCYRFFISVYSFCKTKGYYYWKHKFGWLCVRPPDCCKLAKNPKYDNDVTILRYGVIVKIFWHCFVSLVTFSYWSKFHVNIITGHGIKTIFFYKGLTRNWEIGNNPAFCPISGDWGKLWILNLARISAIDCYWMLQNSRVTAYTDFELLRENQLGRLVTHEATHIYTKFIINNHALLHLWWRENLLKHPKVSKYYDKDCILNLFVPFMSLLTAPFIKSTHILVGVYFIFVKKRPIPNSKVFQ